MPRSNGAPTAYLTFHDGPNPTATPQLLDVLAREDARATFFLIPRHVNEETAPIIRRTFDERHADALHADTRALMLKRPDDLAAALDASADRIAQLTGHRPCAFLRPHAGWRGSAMYAGLDRADYTLAGWSWAMWDWNWWRTLPPERLVKRLARFDREARILVALNHPGIAAIHGLEESDRGRRATTGRNCYRVEEHCSSPFATGGRTFPRHKSQCEIWRVL